MDVPLLDLMTLKIKSSSEKNYLKSCQDSICPYKLTYTDNTGKTWLNYYFGPDENNPNNDCIQVGDGTKNDIILPVKNKGSFRVKILFKNNMINLEPQEPTEIYFMCIGEENISEKDRFLLGKTTIIEVDSIIDNVNPPLLKFHIYKGTFQGSTYEIPGNKRAKLGRAENENIDFHIENDEKDLSGVHCEIFTKNKKFFIKDTLSTNHTWKKLLFNKPFRLFNNSIFKINDTENYFQIKYSKKALITVKGLIPEPSKNICEACKESIGTLHSCLHTVCDNCIEKIGEGSCPFC